MSLKARRRESSKDGMANRIKLNSRQAQVARCPRSQTRSRSAHRRSLSPSPLLAKLSTGCRRANSPRDSPLARFTNELCVSTRVEIQLRKCIKPVDHSPLSLSLSFCDRLKSGITFSALRLATAASLQMDAAASGTSRRTRSSSFNAVVV